jgi:hypothetical protein
MKIFTKNGIAYIICGVRKWLLGGVSAMFDRSVYLNYIDYLKKALVIIMAISGACHVLCSNRISYLTYASGYIGSALWTWGEWISGIIVLACFVTTLAFVVEYLARPIAPRPFKLQSVLIGFLLITSSIVAICYIMVITFGPWQGVGATIGVFMLLFAIKREQTGRPLFVIFAVIFLGLTILSTQTAYQYACRHTDEIIVAGNELMDQYSEKDDMKEIKISDPTVPPILRKLGADKIMVDKDHVCICASGLYESEFQIFRTPPTTYSPVWMSRSKGAGTFEISDKLIMFEND